MSDLGQTPQPNMPVNASNTQVPAEATNAAQNNIQAPGQPQGQPVQGQPVQGQRPTVRPYMTFNPPRISMKSEVEGIVYDFNKGARVAVPKGNYRVRFIDRDACLVLYDAKADGVICTSTKVYYVNFRIEVYKRGDEQKKEPDKLIFAHNYDARGKNVLLKFPDTAMGDVLAWFPYAEEFRKQHGCNLYCALNPKFSSILKAGYPEINFVDTETVPPDLYASYYVGLFAPWDNRDLQPVDWRIVGLQRHAAYLLGVDPVERRPRLTPCQERPIKEPYVCIASQSTAQCKYWNNAFGWLGTVEYLKKLGYRVLCVDRDRISVVGNQGNNIPYGTEDFTGDRPLQERVDLIAHADFFIGLTSGLSWLAWGTGVPVILITGYTAPNIEFYTPYRVQHFHVCNSCCNDMRLEHKYGDFGSCPKFRGTEREYECTRFITPEHVCRTIDRVRADLGIAPLPDYSKLYAQPVKDADEQTETKAAAKPEVKPEVKSETAEEKK